MKLIEQEQIKEKKEEDVRELVSHFNNKEYKVDIIKWPKDKSEKTYKKQCVLTLIELLDYLREENVFNEVIAIDPLVTTIRRQTLICHPKFEIDFEKAGEVHKLLSSKRYQVSTMDALRMQCRTYLMTKDEIEEWAQSKFYLDSENIVKITPYERLLFN